LILKRRQLLKRQLLPLLPPVELAGRKPDGCTDMQLIHLALKGSEPHTLALQLDACKSASGCSLRWLHM